MRERRMFYLNNECSRKYIRMIYYIIKGRAFERSVYNQFNEKLARNTLIFKLNCV